MNSSRIRERLEYIIRLVRNLDSQELTDKVMKTIEDAIQCALVVHIRPEIDRRYAEIENKLI